VTPRRGSPLLAACLALLAGCRSSGPPAQPAAAAPAGPIRLTDVFPASGIDFRLGHGGRSPLNILDTIGHAVALIDCDGDGLLDVVFTGPDQVRLYRNLGAWKFAGITEKSGLRQPGYWQGCAVGDVDNDGRTDLYLAAKGEAALYRGLGGGRFQDVTPASGLAVKDPNRWNSAAEFLDYDGDGRLDLYVGAYVDLGDHSGLCPNAGAMMGCGPLHYRPQKGILYRNAGGFRFVPTGAGALGHGKTLGALGADFDGDGRPDLYAANDQMEGDLFRFSGGRWREEGMASGTALGPDGAVQGGMGVAAADYNGDARLDLFVTTFHQEPHSLYRSDGGSLFSNAAFPSGIAAATTRFVGFGTCFADLDNDGWADLPVANGHPQELIRRVDSTTDYRQPSQVLRNRGDGRFEDVSAGAGPDVTRPIVGRALCAGDLDNDGDVDLVIGDIEGPPLLLRNDSPGGRSWLRVRLEGTRCSRDGRGAVVSCTAGGRRQTLLATTGGSYYSASDPRVHFGLGTAARVEKLTVRWPGGREQTLQDLPANQEILVKEKISRK
jgi:enediyne biosynthesis protein E4